MISTFLVSAFLDTDFVLLLGLFYHQIPAFLRFWVPASALPVDAWNLPACLRYCLEDLHLPYTGFYFLGFWVDAQTPACYIWTLDFVLTT